MSKEENLLTCTVLGSIGQKTKNVLYEPMLVCDNELADFRRDWVHHYHGVRLKIIYAVHWDCES